MIAATNRADTLDPALMRSGRLDRKIEFPHPTEDARAKILQIHARQMNVSGDVNFEELARSTDDFNAAQLKARPASVCSSRPWKLAVGYQAASQSSGSQAVSLRNHA